MEKPVQVMRHNKLVWETPGMDIMRPEHCMCLHCDKLNLENNKHCSIAERFYTICVENGNAFILTRCEYWEEVKS
jgi:hypothetical protein